MTTISLSCPRTPIFISEVSFSDFHPRSFGSAVAIVQRRISKSFSWIANPLSFSSVRMMFTPFWPFLNSKTSLSFRIKLAPDRHPHSPFQGHKLPHGSNRMPLLKTGDTLAAQLAMCAKPESPPPQANTCCNVLRVEAKTVALMLPNWWSAFAQLSETTRPSWAYDFYRSLPKSSISPELC